MKSAESFLSRQGLEFFGRVSASISHEIKNVLAVIAETNGLTEDLLVMHSTRGLPLDYDRMSTLAERIRRQLVRADEIIKNMNRFSHSIDEPIKSVDLRESLLLTLALISRHASYRNIAMETRVENFQISVPTNPFFLQHLLWLCLDFAMSSAGDAKKLTIGLQKESSKDAGKIVIDGLEKLQTWPVETFPDEVTLGLCQELGIQLAGDADAKSLNLLVPCRVR